MMRACFFNVPTWARVAGCPVRNEVLGTDYTAIVERAETVLLPAFDAWRSGEADAKGPGAVHGTLDWVFAEYRADRRFTKLDPNTRRRNHEVGLDTPGLGATACATMRSRGSRRRVNRRRLRERGCRSPRSCERAIWMSRCVHSCARAYIGHPLDTALGVFCLTLCNDWRSLGKWFSRGKTIGCEHKHPYPPSLNLKAVLPQSQTVAIASAAAWRWSCRPSTQWQSTSPRLLRARNRQAVANSKMPISPPPLTGDQHRERAERHRPGRSVGAAVLSMIAHTASMDVEYHVVSPAMVGLHPCPSSRPI